MKKGIFHLVTGTALALALSVSTRVHVMVRGEIQRSADPDELRGTDDLRTLYLKGVPA